MGDGIWNKVVTVLSENLSLLLVVVGTLLLLLGLAGGVMHGGWLPIKETPARITAVLVGAIIIGLGIFSWTSVPKKPNPRTLGIKILYPKDGDHVGIVDIGGSIAEELPKGYSLAVFKIFPNSRTFAPIGEVMILGDGTWKAERCNIGGNAGDRRIVGVYLVGPEARVLLDYFNEAGARHRTTMNALKAATGQAGDYLPHLTDGTSDLIQCHTVGLYRS
jgi:hypothetical protein